MSTYTRLRFALIGPTFPFRGGIAHYTTLLYQNLCIRHSGILISFKRQYPPWLFPGRSDLDPSDVPLQVPSERIIDPLNPLSWRRAVQRINQLQPDAVFLQWWVPFWGPTFGTMARWIKQSTDARLFYICHNVLPHEKARGPMSVLTRLLARYALAPGDHFVVHSGQDEQQLRRLFHDLSNEPGPPRSRSVYRMSLPTWAPLSAMCESVNTGDERTALSIKAKHVALFFGFVRPYKGLRYLVGALPAVLEHVDLHLLVVGEFWEPVQVYRDQIARLGVEHAVTIVDRYVPNEELRRYFGVADVVVLPYESATQSAVLQLAYGFGVPAITTRVGGLSEVVRDGETGLLAAPADSGDLARAMVHFFADNLGATFRDNIHRERARFGWDHLVSVVEECMAAGA